MELVTGQEQSQEQVKLNVVPVVEQATQEGIKVIFKFKKFVEIVTAREQ